MLRMLRSPGRIALLAGPLALVSLVGCGAFAPQIAPMRTLERLPARCEGGTTQDDLSAAEPTFTSSDGPFLDVGVHLVRMSADAATAAFGVRFPGVDAQVVDESDAAHVFQSLRDDGELVMIQRATLSLASGQPGHLALTNDVSYVTGFDLVGVAGATIADPVVESREFGTRAEVTATFEDPDGPWAFGISLESVQPYHPTPIVKLAAPGTGAPVEVQTPIFNRVRLETDASVRPGRLLVLAGPDAGRPGDVLVAVIVPKPDDALAL